MVRGRKNYLPHAPLIMGFTVLFKLVSLCPALDHEHVSLNRLHAQCGGAGCNACCNGLWAASGTVLG